MTTYRSNPKRTGFLVIGGVAAALVVGGIAGALLARSPSPSSTPTTTTPAAVASATTTTTAPASGGAATPITTTATSPANGATAVVATAAISVTLSGPPAADSPMPVLSPSTPGSWAVSGDTLTFTPTTPFLPLATETLTIPGGPSGVRSTDGGTMTAPSVVAFRVENGSILRLQQLLSLLSYSPLTWSSSAPAVAPTDPAAQAAALYAPPAGTFTWASTGWPTQLTALWQEGRYSVFTKGLVMSFQADHALTPNGAIGPGLWVTLLQAVAANNANSGGYDYALADKASPEHLTIWHDGARVLQSKANTGVASQPTPDGNFPVNTRLRRQVMRGTNTDGSHYADLVQYIAYFHGNDAVHYMPRSDYGIPQSLGCIELPLADAAKAWPYLAYGTIVSVIH